MGNGLSSAWLRMGMGVAVLLGMTMVLYLQSLFLFRMDNTTGWVLLLLMVGQIVYHLRKQYFFLNSGNSSNWYQVHALVGIGTVMVFFLHVERLTSTSQLEMLLGLLFAVVAITGILGVVVSKVLSRRLSDSEQELRLEEIPSMEHYLHECMDELTRRVLSTSASQAVTSSAVKALTVFRNGESNFWPYLFGTRHPSQTVARHLKTLDSHFTVLGVETQEKMESLFRSKENLHFHKALQSGLRFWPFIHTSLTYGLFIIALTHGVFATLYTTSMP